MGNGRQVKPKVMGMRNNRGNGELKVAMHKTSHAIVELHARRGNEENEPKYVFSERNGYVRRPCMHEDKRERKRTRK